MAGRASSSTNGVLDLDNAKTRNARLSARQTSWAHSRRAAGMTRRPFKRGERGLLTAVTAGSTLGLGCESSAVSPPRARGRVFDPASRFSGPRVPRKRLGHHVPKAAYWVRGSAGCESSVIEACVTSVTEPSRGFSREGREPSDSAPL